MWLLQYFNGGIKLNKTFPLNCSIFIAKLFAKLKGKFIYTFRVGLNKIIISFFRLMP